MHCVDCHFEQDAHGDGHLYGSVRDAVEIACGDCHGTIRERTRLVTSGPAAPEGGRDLAVGRAASGQRRFVERDGKVFQRSAVTEGVEREVPQIADGETRNPLSWRAKTIQRDNETWGDPGAEVAHDRTRMTCFSCHTAWMASCFGCHLTMRANQRVESKHFEGDRTRNFTPYNWQTIRADTFMLGVDGDVTGNRVAPARSACAVLVGSQNSIREWIYSQQQTISAEGFSGIAFSTHVPHTVRGKESKGCADCHLAESGDKTAWMAQLLMQVEQTNARFVEALPEKIDFITIDASFISLKILLPVVKKWAGPIPPVPLFPDREEMMDGLGIVALIKPQFEAGKKDVARGDGVIRDPEIHRQVLNDVLAYARQEGFGIHDVIKSPLLGPKGNAEFLVWLREQNKDVDIPTFVDLKF